MVLSKGAMMFSPGSIDRQASLESRPDPVFREETKIPSFIKTLVQHDRPYYAETQIDLPKTKRVPRFDLQP